MSRFMMVPGRRGRDEFNLNKRDSKGSAPTNPSVLSPFHPSLPPLSPSARAERNEDKKMTPDIEMLLLLSTPKDEKSSMSFYASLYIIRYVFLTSFSNCSVTTI
ncbi:unnamed protein product [Musa banksii]